MTVSTQGGKVPPETFPGLFDDLSKASGPRLKRFEDDAQVVDQLVALGRYGMASGVDGEFDIDAFVETIPASG